MKKVIYIEKEIKNHIRTKLICNRFKNSEVILIDKYSEIFNKKNQSFRRQKLNPSIIIAKKKNNFLYETPANYGIGNNYNYYFSYMLNCMFDCKYCFLQGLYTSANYVIFVNYEDFLEEIKKLSLKNSKKNITLFSGYDCDSLAFEPVTQFMKYLMNKVNKFNNIELEIRTKSSYTQIFSSKPINNVIIAYSFTPDRFSRKYEIGVPNVEKRIKSLANLSSMGWKVGIRLDPIICYEGWEEDYCELTKNIFKKIDEKKIHSVSIGKLRFPNKIYKKIEKENLSESLLFNLKKKDNMYEYNFNFDLKKFCIDNLKEFIDQRKIFFNN